MDISVIWDLMIHDIDLVHALLGGEISGAKCQGRAELGVHLDEAIAQYDIDQARVKLTASRIAPEPKRAMVLEYSSGRIMLDFLNREIENTTSFATPDDLAGLVPDPLGVADEMFFAACAGYGTPLISGHEAARAVATAEHLERLALK